MTTTYYTADELSAAYRKARLRYQRITLTKALTDPLLYKSLCLVAEAARKEQQQHGTPAPMKRAA